jgi:hypothetical protein
VLVEVECGGVVWCDIVSGLKQVVRKSTVGRAPRSFHVQSVQVHSVLWPLGDIFRILRKNFILKAKAVDSSHVLTGVGLQTASHESLREEEDWKWKRRWLAANEPLPHKFHAEQQVRKP